MWVWELWVSVCVRGHMGAVQVLRLAWGGHSVTARAHGRAGCGLWEGGGKHPEYTWGWAGCSCSWGLIPLINTGIPHTGKVGKRPPTWLSVPEGHWPPAGPVLSCGPRTPRLVNTVHTDLYPAG